MMRSKPSVFPPVVVVASLFLVLLADVARAFAPPSSTATASRPAFAPVVAVPSRRRVPAAAVVFASKDDEGSDDAPPSSASKDEDATKEDGGADVLSFDDAAEALRDEEDVARADRSGLTDREDELAERFNAKKAEYDSMRERIRARASNLGVEKSVATAQAIADANARAQAGEKTQLDLSAFEGGGLLGDDEEELTEEEKAEIDKIASKPIWEQAIEEFSYAQWPSISASLKLAGFMALLFAFTATFILKADDLIRNAYTDFGLIPRPDEVYDFGDLELPDKWTDMMNEDDLLP